MLQYGLSRARLRLKHHITPFTAGIAGFHIVEHVQTSGHEHRVAPSGKGGSNLYAPERVFPCPVTVSRSS